MSLELPVLRHGSAYASLDTRALCDPRSGETLATIGQANPALVARDLRRWPTVLAPLAEERACLLRQVAARLADSPSDDHQETRLHIGATTGLTGVQVEAQIARLAMSLQELAGLVPHCAEPRPPVAFVLPSNAPGVHTAWLAALALGHPVALKPGALEPWTPYWLARLLAEEGLPPAFLGIYPGDHDVAAAALEAAPYGVLFGDASTVARYESEPTIDVRGPGRSKAYVTSAAWEDPTVLQGLAEGVSAFGGRSCLNTSTIVLVDGTAEEVRALTSALNEALRGVPDDELAAWPGAGAAEAIASGLRQLSDGQIAPLIVRRTDGLEALRPLASAAEDPMSPWAQTEAPFPWVAVTAVASADLTTWTGPTLAASVLGADRVGRLLQEAGAVLRVVPDGGPTTGATDVRFHLDSLRRLTA